MRTFGARAAVPFAARLVDPQNGQATELTPEMPAAGHRLVEAVATLGQRYDCRGRQRAVGCPGGISVARLVISGVVAST